MSYYKLGGKPYSIHCSDAEAANYCNTKCESCPHCEVENLETGEKFPFVGSDIKAKYYDGDE